MNDEIKPGDLVALNESGNVVKATNESQPIGQAMTVYEDIGLLVRYAGGIVNVTIAEDICAYCKVGRYVHETTMGVSMMDHPFFKNNLEYLEWEAGKHE